MQNFDFMFFQLNNFISKVKFINRINLTNDNSNSDLIEDDFIEVNKKFNQSNTLNKFYNIYGREKEKYLKSNSNEDKANNNLKYLVDAESEILKKTIFNFFRGIFFYIFLIRILNVTSDFLAPFIIGKLLGLSTKSDKNLEKSEKMLCFIYITIFILSCLTRIFTSMIFNYNLSLIRNQIEFIVNDLIYKKILVIKKDAKNLEGKITKFLNDDISTFFGFIINLNRTWELPIEIFIATYGVYKNVSFAFIPGLLFAIILLYVNYRIAVNITDTNKDLYKVRLERQQMEILALKNVKSIKFEFLENFFIEKIFVKKIIYLIVLNKFFKY